MIPMLGVLGTVTWVVYALHAWPLRKPMPGEGDTVGFAGEAVKDRLRPDDENSEYDLIRGYLRNGVEPEDLVQECISLA